MGTSVLHRAVVAHAVRIDPADLLSACRGVE